MSIPEGNSPSDSDLSSATASTLRTVANVLGVAAGVLFLLAFGIHFARQEEAHLFFLGMGLLFLFFPVLMNRLIRPDR